jgi:pimeloyl-ACP methyl ester carboxylesterase
MPGEYAGKVDFIEAGGDGPLVLLVHASMAGARQWSSLIGDLGGRFHTRAVNLFGYGGTPAWSSEQSPTLADFAALVARAVPSTERKIFLVGHSFGGAVAIHAAARQLRGRVERLVLVEPSLFYLLEQEGQRVAFREISSLARFTNDRIVAGAVHDAAGRFIDYWSGHGTWAGMPEGKKAALAGLIPDIAHEWNVVLSGTTTAAEWAALLPRHTLLLLSARARRPSRGIVQALWRHAGPGWELTNIARAGHMAPVTHPHIVNPIIKGFLAEVPMVPSWSRRTGTVADATYKPRRQADLITAQRPSASGINAR